MEHDHLNKLSTTFQQKDQCEIKWKLAKWFLKNHDFIHVNSTVGGKYYKYKKSAESDVAPAGIKSYKFLFVLKQIYFAVFKKLIG